MSFNSSSELQTAIPDQEVDLYGRADLMSEFEQNQAEDLRLNPDLKQTSSALGQLAADICKDTDPFANVDPDFQESVLRSHLAMRELLTPLGIALPELSDFARAGVDFGVLANDYTVMQRLN